MSDRDDSERLARARSGDREAYSELLDQHVSGVRRFLYRLGVTETDLDDLTQEVFMAAIRRLEGFRGESRFSAWLYGIAVNVRRASRRRAGGSCPGRGSR